MLLPPHGLLRSAHHVESTMCKKDTQAADAVLGPLCFDS